MRYVTRTSALEYEDFNSAKTRLLERAEKFGEISYKVCKLNLETWIQLLQSILSFVTHDALYIPNHIQRKCSTLNLTMLLQARRIIAMLSQDFIVDGCTILVHGFSRVVLEVLKAAAQSRKLFRVFCTGLC